MEVVRRRQPGEVAPAASGEALPPGVVKRRVVADIPADPPPFPRPERVGTAVPEPLRVKVEEDLAAIAAKSREESSEDVAEQNVSAEVSEEQEAEMTDENTQETQEATAEETNEAVEASGTPESAEPEATKGAVRNRHGRDGLPEETRSQIAALAASGASKNSVSKSLSIAPQTVAKYWPGADGETKAKAPKAAKQSKAGAKVAAKPAQTAAKPAKKAALGNDVAGAVLLLLKGGSIDKKTALKLVSADALLDAALAG